MLYSEELITLVQAHPVIWDQGHVNYSNKSKKLKAWQAIAEKLNCRVEEAKSRWTNLRDLFRRELKKSIRMAKETGDTVHEPRWRHFKPMLYLKDHVIKDEVANSLQYDESFSIYPQTILEDGSGENNGEENTKEDEEQEEDEESNSTPSYQEKVIVPSKKRTRDHSEELQYHTPIKRQQQQYSSPRPKGALDYGDCSSGRSSHTEMDEDYHFLMSILPAIRRVKQDRKTCFKMKVLQLIVEEENSDS